MSHIGRPMKNLETPRPLLKSSRSQNKNIIVIEELIQLIENFAAALEKGVCSSETIALLLLNLRSHGPQLEQISKDTLDRAFVTFRNASQDERLNIMSRLNLLELIELRAKSWLDDGTNTYYKHKATNVEPEGGATTIEQQFNTISTSPTSMAGISLNMNAGISQGTHILGPGELIRTSGKFLKPTKIPGKNYSKDEVVIRNADSGKVMGIKGRRVHMIEELSETIISFQRVNPGAKERLVQITGPNEDKINYAKQLIEDTIRRNASPVRLESTINQGGNNNGSGGGGGGSCSSLASSASDEILPRALNRISLGATNLSTGPGGYIGNTNFSSGSSGLTLGGKLRSTGPANNNNNQILLHSFSTNDATVGEYKYTVNVNGHLLKITGDSCELVRIAKLHLDEFFNSKEFLSLYEAGTLFDEGATYFTPTSGFADSGIGLNYMASQITSNNPSVEDDDVFIVEPTTGPSIQMANGLVRSKRSHFTKKDAEDKPREKKKSEPSVRIIYETNRLIYLSRSVHSWTLPRDWDVICQKFPAIVRNKDLNDEQNRFDADKYFLLTKSGKRTVVIDDVTSTANNQDIESPDPE